MKITKITLLSIFILFFSLGLYGFDLENDIIQRSHNFLGTPYVYGGESPSGFDCSGFVYYLFKDFLDSWPRGTRGQAERGSPVSKDNLRPGDLTFWATGSDPRRITHVSLYLGNDSMIHALSEGSRIGINISSMNSCYWKPKYLFSRRIFTQAEAPREEENKIYERVYPRGRYRGPLAGEPNGQGRMELNNGSVYEGEFKDGQYHGQGRYTTRDGAVYEGSFVDGYLHGHAVRTWPSGSRYEGEYRQGRETGGWFTGQSGTTKWVVKGADGSWIVTDGPTDSDTGPAPRDLVADTGAEDLEYIHGDNPWDDREGTAYIPADWERGDYFERIYQRDSDAFEASRRAEQEAFEKYKTRGN